MFHPPTILYTMSYDTGMFIILFMYGMTYLPTYLTYIY